MTKVGSMCGADLFCGHLPRFCGDIVEGLNFEVGTFHSFRGKVWKVLTKIILLRSGESRES